jgi:GT2 family glycosyltransferase
MAAPAVSVLIPAYNGERYLDAALAGVLADDDPPREVIVVDDGSTDRTPAILDAWRQKDARLVVLTQANAGVVAALEHGRRAVRAPLIARLDADDIAYPGRLAAQAAAFARDPGLVLLGAALDRIDGEGKRTGVIAYPTGSARLLEILPRANAFSSSSVMMRADAVEAVGGYRPLFPAAEDYDLWLRLSEHGRIANLPERLGAYRVHGSSMSAVSAVRQALSAALARRCAALRREGKADPAVGRKAPPDLDAEVDPGDPLAAELRLFRALSFADAATFERRRPTDEDAALITAPSLRHAEKRLAQRAIVNMLRLKALPPSLSATRALARLLRIDPLKGARLLLAGPR